MMILMLITLFRSYQFDFFEDSTVHFSKGIGFFTLVFIILYLGTRPVSYVFQDMAAYTEVYRQIQDGGKIFVTRDYLFNYFMIFSAKIMGERWFFFLCGLIYIIPCYVFAKKYGGSYWYYVFFIFVASYMFWPFGTNGIRNGLGTSLFILALSYYERKVLMYGLMVLAFGMHSSLSIPILAFVIANMYKNPKAYLYVWLAAIPLSLVGGNFWEGLFGSIGFGADTRAEDYLTKGTINKDLLAYTGFRWDFLFYSSFAAFAGWYFIFKKNCRRAFITIN